MNTSRRDTGWEEYGNFLFLDGCNTVFLDLVALEVYRKIHQAVYLRLHLYM